MKVVVCYNYPTAEHGPEHSAYAERFVVSYRENPPLVDHSMIVISSGGPPNGSAISQFSFIGGTQFIETDDEGWDCGNYVKAAHQISCDMLFCCGGPCYFKRPGWLRRIVSVWNELGPGMYGTLATYEVRPHIQTTGFAVPPSFLREYPSRIITRADRYEFEHGHSALFRQVEAKGFSVRLVTWDGIWPIDQWRKPNNIYRRGDQSNCLTFWTRSDEYEAAPPHVKLRMNQLADELNL